MAQEKKQFSLPELEEEVLKFWEEANVFEQSLEKTKKGKRFVFYEGPPTANGMPHIGHAETRAFKDAVLRYKTMRGFYVPRRAGWDTHGLPVEIQVEKEMGFKTKRDIERYGIAQFNRKAKESVWRYKDAWEKSTRRLGFWIDMKRPYVTYETSYMETLWWIIKEFWKRGLLEEDFKVVPWCTRCQTGLSSHELAQGYQTVRDTSVYVRFNIASSDPRWKDTYIFSWTTTPWTLPGNVALAVNPNLEYVKVVFRPPGSTGKKTYAVLEKHCAEELGKRFAWFMPGFEPVSAKDLIGLSYEPLFQVKELQTKTAYKVYPADFVTADEGTGVVHTAVMYGDDDYRLGGKVGLPKFHTVEEDGRFSHKVDDGLAGLYVKDSQTELKLLKVLEDKELLVYTEKYEHEYPHCWRCGTPLLYYARRGWWVNVSRVKSDLVENNQKINWIPEHLKEGRFGEFLGDVRDWAFSRERYWGTPLPIWKCGACSHIELIGSIDDLRKKVSPSRNSYLIMRHGEAVSNIKGIMSGKGDAHPLTIQGREDVEAAVRKLKKEGIDVIYASPVRRAKETAELVATALGLDKIYFDTRLAEMNAGVFDGRSTEVYHNHFASIYEKFDKRPAGGESLTDVSTRVSECIKDIESRFEGKKVLIIGHDYSLWMLYSSALGLTREEAVALLTVKEREGFIGLAEARKVPYLHLPRDEHGEINLHRPFVDTVEFPCPKCKAPSHRVEAVADVWFDSGSMPFAQHHYPFNKTPLPFPADFICEAVDQARGWFYTLLAVSTLLKKGAPYKNVISLGHVLDKNGQKMSKSKGNVVDPEQMIAKYGADTLRWFFYTVNPPGEPKRFDEKDIVIEMRGFLATLWNSFILFDTYAEDVSRQVGTATSKHVLDRWVLQKLNSVKADMTARMDTYDITGAARALEQFVIADFSQWYLRRSRKRFQRPDTKQEKRDVTVTTAQALEDVCVLAAPFVPFLSEGIYRSLREFTRRKEVSVHLLAWPTKKKAGRTNKKSGRILQDMELVREVVAAALKLRSEAGIKVRQPLNELQITTQSSDGSPHRMIGANTELQNKTELLDLIKDEVNVKNITFGDEMALDTKITPELKEEGFVREFVRNIQEMRRDLGLSPHHVIRCVVSGDAEFERIISKKDDAISRDINAKEIVIGGKRLFQIEREIAIDGKGLWVGLRR